jgi:ParB-like chromosome segregation protein Spo0J
MHPTHVVVPITRIKTNPKNARTHSKKQIRKIAASVREFGFAAPVLIDEQRRAHRRARPPGGRQIAWMSTIPAIVIGVSATPGSGR